MASNPGARVALLPIRPRFARSIMSGEKKVEFRKVRFRSNVSRVVVYASSPIKRVLGYFHVANIHKAPPAELWARYAQVGGLDRDEFLAYYASSGEGVAIGIGEVRSLPDPLPLDTLGSLLRVPQSFAYLTDEAFQKLVECLEAQHKGESSTK